MDIMGPMDWKLSDRQLELLNYAGLAAAHGVKVCDLYKIKQNGKPIMTRGKAWAVSMKLADMI